MRYVIDFLIDFVLLYRVNREKRTRKINDRHKILIWLFAATLSTPSEKIIQNRAGLIFRHHVQINVLHNLSYSATIRDVLLCYLHNSKGNISERTHRAFIYSNEKFFSKIKVFYIYKSKDTVFCNGYVCIFMYVHYKYIFLKKQRQSQCIFFDVCSTVKSTLIIL